MNSSKSMHISILRLNKSVDEIFALTGQFLYGFNILTDILQDYNILTDLHSLKLNPIQGYDYFHYLDSSSTESIYHKINLTTEHLLGHINSKKFSFADAKLHLPFISEIFFLTSKDESNRSNQVLHPSNLIGRSLLFTGDFIGLDQERIFNELTELGMFLKSKHRIDLAMALFTHVLDDEVQRLFNFYKIDGHSNTEITELIQENIDIERLVRRAYRGRLHSICTFAGVIGNAQIFAGNVIHNSSQFSYVTNEYFTFISNVPELFENLHLNTSPIQQVPSNNVLIIRNDGTTSELQFTEDIDFGNLHMGDETISHDIHFQESLRFFSEINQPTEFKFKSKVKGLPGGLLTSFQQYLLFFREYVKTAKQKEITFDVAKTGDDLELTITLNNDAELEVIQGYLGEYLDLARRRVVPSIEVEGNPRPEEIDFLRLRLEQQLNNLHAELKFRDFKISFLEASIYELRIDKRKLLDIVSSAGTTIYC